MNVTILDDYGDALRRLPSFARLAGHRVRVWNDHAPDEGELAARLADTDALVLIRERTRISAGLLARCPRLGLITQYGATPHIDLDACTRAGIVVSSQTGGRPQHATAELTWGLVLAALRHIPQEAARMKGGQWQSTVGTRLHGHTLGIYGFGRIGELVAGYGRAFGMRVQVWGRDTTLARARAAGFEVAASREALFENSDVLSLHMRLTPDTRGIVGAADLARMKPTALIVNTARAELVAHGALEAALKAGRPGMAAVDVFENEPMIGTPHPLTALPNVVATPHLGYVEHESLDSGFASAYEQLDAWAAGAPIRVINPEVLPRMRRPVAR